MRKPKQRVIFSLFILSICYGIIIAADSSCGDWEPYKDEKCFKVFNILDTEDNAEKFCNTKENNATLMTIGSKDEQDFLSNLLFKTHKVVNDIWIGAKNSSNKFKWADGSEIIFSNWAQGSPNNEENNNCVQMMPEVLSRGKWVSEPCNKKNLVVCQKFQVYSSSVLQNKLLYTRKLLDYINLFNDKWAYFKIFSDYNNRTQVLIAPKVTKALPWGKAIEVCKGISSSLLVIESSEKGLIVQSFLDLFSSQTYAWLGGYKDSGGKLKWMSNGKDISYTNWAPNQPVDGTYVVISIEKTSPNYRKWFMSTLTTDTFWVICETSFSS